MNIKFPQIDTVTTLKFIKCCNQFISRVALLQKNNNHLFVLGDLIPYLNYEYDKYKGSILHSKVHVAQ